MRPERMSADFQRSIDTVPPASTLPRPGEFSTVKRVDAVLLGAGSIKKGVLQESDASCLGPVSPQRSAAARGIPMAPHCVTVADFGSHCGVWTKPLARRTLRIGLARSAG